MTESDRKILVLIVPQPRLLQIDSVNVSAVGLMAVVTLQLGSATLTVPSSPFVDFLALAIAIVSAILAIRYQINAVWLVLGAALIGWGTSILRYIY